jgi:hypothetical protein
MCVCLCLSVPTNEPLKQVTIYTFLTETWYELYNTGNHPHVVIYNFLRWLITTW